MPSAPVSVGVLSVLVLLTLAADNVLGKVYSRCELAAALKSKGISGKQDIATWVCIGERLSSINTDTATDPDDDPDGTVYHGVFLISDKWWCDRGKAKGCGVTCADMKRTLESNIECAKKVYVETRRLNKEKNGFKAWGAYDDCLEPEDYVRGCAGLEEDEAEEDLTIFQRSGFGKGKEE
ncbi:hypothetical protein ONE63_009402 [Megalurothrips usitatus]|uniref:lysozyme n=1 Tax=Megalurothrips usitatus TaxID=439358 RepID=A0AAV7XN41_9NEOP|nr:hypothetical protein ONE63_009402 [Megalurothrips usitatus]